MASVPIELYKSGGQKRCLVYIRKEVKCKARCDLNVPEHPTAVTLVRLKLSKVKVKLPLCTT
jgi:hypothetical protein